MTIPENLTPYDTGYRLEPLVWIRGNSTVSDRTPNAVGPDDYGKVDFTDEFGETVFTAWIQQTETGYILRVDEHQDVGLGFETSTQRHVREQAMMQVDAGLRAVAAQNPKRVTYDHGDPDAFGLGNFILTPEERNDLRFIVTEEFVGTDTSDPDRVPNSWTADIYQYDKAWASIWTREYGPDEIDQLADTAREWVNGLPEPSPWPAGHAQQTPAQHPAPGL
ncbi:hypothetical protein D3248_01805 [Leucobacter zeae]|nr:hypothetical protein [Leucobacter zeae]